MSQRNEDKRQKELFQRRGIEDPEIEIVEEILVRDLEQQEDKMETAGASVEREDDKASINSILQLLEKIKLEFATTSRELKAEVAATVQKLEALESALKLQTKLQIRR